MKILRPEHTFCEVPFAYGLAALEADVAVFSARHGSPYTPGTPSHSANAPDAVRQALSWYDVGREQWDFDVGAPVMGTAKVVDAGDIDLSLTDSAGNRENIQEATQAILRRGVKPIMLGGDDSTPIPFIEGFGATGKPLTVLQIDAHIDWRDEVNGETHGFSSTMRRASEFAHVKNIIQIGAREAGSARKQEVEDAKAWGAQIFPMRTIATEGVKKAIDAIPEGADVLLAIDVDGLDPTLMPGVLSPAYGGLQFQDMLTIFDGVTSRANIAGASFVEFVPEKDTSGLCGSVIARLACNIIARMV